MHKYEVGFDTPIPMCNSMMRIPIRNGSFLKCFFTYLVLPFYPCCRGFFYKRYFIKVR